MTQNDSPPPLWRTKLERAWQHAAVLTLNFIVLLVLVNLALAPLIKPYDRSGVLRASADSAPATVRINPKGQPRAGPLRIGWQMEYVDMDAYDGVPVEAVEKTLDDFTLMGMHGIRYQPWVQFDMPPYAGTVVHIDRSNDEEFDTRRSVLDPAIPVPADGRIVEVWTFGGSTTFGWDVADSWTVPSKLWSELQKKANASGQKLRLHVTNYGRGLYYSSQEVLLFSRLLKAGRRCDIAVFLDGLNDCSTIPKSHDQPNFTARLTGLLQGQQEVKPGLEAYGWIPMVKLAYLIHERAHVDAPVAERHLSPTEAADETLRVYQENIRLAGLLAREYGCRAHFFWQPCTLYHYDATLHRRFPDVPQGERDTYSACYARMAEHPGDAIFLGDAIQAFGHRKVFVDDVHYNPSFATFLATLMAAHIDPSETPDGP